MLNLEKFIEEALSIEAAEPFKLLEIKRLMELENLLSNCKTVSDVDYSKLSFEDISLIEKYQDYVSKKSRKITMLSLKLARLPRKLIGCNYI